MSWQYWLLIPTTLFHFVLSNNFSEIPAANSSHFVWTDEPEIIVRAIEQLLNSKG